MTTVTRDDVIHRFRAMASEVTVRVIDPTCDPSTAVMRVEGIFRDIERSCSRFDDSSDLMRANARAGEWTQVAPACRGAGPQGSPRRTRGGRRHRRLGWVDMGAEHLVGRLRWRHECPAGAGTRARTCAGRRHVDRIVGRLT